MCSRAGRDKNSFMVVVEAKEGICYLCDGKKRPLGRPKKKNIKHIEFTDSFVEEKKFTTNRALKKALAAYRNECLREEK